MKRKVYLTAIKTVNISSNIMDREGRIHNLPFLSVAYPGILFQQIQLSTVDRENGDLGAVAP